MDQMCIRDSIKDGRIVQAPVRELDAVHGKRTLHENVTVQSETSDVYKRQDYSFSTAVGLFNTVVNVILLIAVNKVVAKMNDGKGL